MGIADDNFPIDSGVWREVGVVPKVNKLLWNLFLITPLQITGCNKFKNFPSSGVVVNVASLAYFRGGMAWQNCRPGEEWHPVWWTLSSSFSAITFYTNSLTILFLSIASVPQKGNQIPFYVRVHIYLFAESFSFCLYWICVANFTSSFTVLWNTSQSTRSILFCTMIRVYVSRISSRTLWSEFVIHCPILFLVMSSSPPSSGSETRGQNEMQFMGCDLFLSSPKHQSKGIPEICRRSYLRVVVDGTRFAINSYESVVTGDMTDRLTGCEELSPHSGLLAERDKCSIIVLLCYYWVLWHPQVHPNPQTTSWSE